MGDLWNNKVIKVEGFNESAPPYYLRNLASADWMEAGKGYWVYMTEDKLWTVEN